VRFAEPLGVEGLAEPPDDDVNEGSRFMAGNYPAP
jgi:hypothetical protein